MKLNDPFGRLESRHQKGYEAMCASLRQGGIDTPEAAEMVLRQAGKRGMAVIGIGLLVVLAVSLVLPKAAPLLWGLELFLVVWVVTSTLNGRRYIKRFIEEELKSS